MGSVTPQASLKCRCGTFCRELVGRRMQQKETNDLPDSPEKDLRDENPEEGFPQLAQVT